MAWWWWCAYWGDMLLPGELGEMAEESDRDRSIAEWDEDMLIGRGGGCGGWLLAVEGDAGAV